MTLRDIGESVKTVSGAAVPFSSLDDNDDIRGYLDYISRSPTLSIDRHLPERDMIGLADLLEVLLHGTLSPQDRVHAYVRLNRRTRCPKARKTERGPHLPQRDRAQNRRQTRAKKLAKAVFCIIPR